MKENDIRPEKLYKRYLELSLQDAENCFGDDIRHDINCVACGSEDAEVSFDKLGFQYIECKNCHSLYQSPRPSLAAFEAFYRDSESSNYWAEVFFPATAELRRESIFRPRVQSISGIAREKEVDIKRLIDVGAGYGMFLDEWRAFDSATELVAVEPSSSLAGECRAKGFHTVEQIAEDVKGYDGYADLVVCFEVLEHVFDPLSFLKSLAKLARPGGLVLISTLSIDGFDLQVLWDKSSQVFPPHHINFLSVEGFKNLFQRAGLFDTSVTTPGKLDVDIVKNASMANQEILGEQRFIKKLVENNNLSDSFQGFLADNCLSSHAWVVGRVPC
ncbi:class I SAM-dependent methyltransferase [Porticoccaceae bacterium]|nr:class I SAM-dependent methyltransferase [Porticoccaceae bacterium]